MEEYSIGTVLRLLRVVSTFSKRSWEQIYMFKHVICSQLGLARFEGFVWLDWQIEKRKRLWE